MVKVNERVLLRKVLMLSAGVSVFTLCVVGVCVMLIVRLLPVQWMIVSSVGIVIFGIAYFLYILYCWSAIRKLRELKSDMVKMLDTALLLPFKLSFTAFFFWLGGSFLIGIIFYFFFHFTIYQAFFSFLIGAIGGTFGPLLVYYFYKREFAKEFVSAFEELKDYSIYKYAERFPFVFKKLFPVSLVFLISCILFLLIFLRLRDESVFGTIVKIGRIELQSESAVIGVPFEMEKPTSEVSKTVFELAGRGKDFYIEPRTDNVLVFRKEDGEVHGVVYNSKELIGLATSEAWLLWVAIIIPLGIFSTVIFLCYKDDKESFDKLVELISGKPHVFPTDDEWNSVFYTLCKERDEREKTMIEVGAEKEEMYEKLKRFQASIDNIRKKFEELEKSRGKLGDAFGRLYKSLLSVKGVLEDRGGEDVHDELSVVLIEISKQLNEMSEELEKGIDEVHNLIKDAKISAEVVVRFQQLLTSVDKYRGENPVEMMDDIIKSISEGKDNLVEAVDRIGEAKGYAMETETEFTHVVDSIREVKERVKKVSEIVNVIKDILEETNILSLNAAIIAAQSGEKGKSFAVVAEEIKELADRTAMSTGEIKKIVGGLGENVNGMEKKISDLGERVGYFDRSLSEVIHSMEDVSEHIGEIRDKCFEFASVVEGVITEIRRVQGIISDMPQDISQIKDKDVEAVDLDRVRGFMFYITMFIKNLKKNVQKGVDRLEDIKRSRERTTGMFNRIKNDIENVVSDAETASLLYNDVENLIKDVYESVKKLRE